MPTVTLRFKLPEELSEFKCANNGHLYKIVLDEILDKLRTMSKYEDKTDVNIDELRKMIFELKNEYGVSDD